LQGYLRSGGNLLSLGGPCLREPIYRSSRGWVTRKSAASPSPPRPMVTLSADLAALKIVKQAGAGQEAEVTADHDSSGNPAVRVVVPELKSYYYAGFKLAGGPQNAVVEFCARGDGGTEYLCVDAVEDDGSRWKAAVPLSTQWRTYDIPAAEFLGYASEKRGGGGDYFHAERAARIGFGFPASLLGKGKHSFEISQLRWRESDVPAAEILLGRTFLPTLPALGKAFGSPLKIPEVAIEVPCFPPAAEYRRAAGLRGAPGQRIFAPALDIVGPVSGWIISVAGGGDFLRSSSKPSGSSPTRQAMPRVIPLLLTPDGQPAASLLLHAGGPYAGGRWACFGITDRDLFPRGDRQRGEQFVALVASMLADPLFHAIEPRFTVREGRVRMEVAATISPGRSAGNLKIRTRLAGLDGKKPAREQTTTVRLVPGRALTALALEADDEPWDWTAFRLECSLVDQGRVLDRLSTSLDVRGTFLAVCDKMLATQRRRGDGKFSGIGFVDNRGARALLAAYDLTANKDYLNAAVAWGHAIIAQQRPDGGYRMGYGQHPEGEECFVADGGEIACGIARLVDYVPPGDRQRFFDSVKAYMAYRDSFRCPGGGIGVGWCKRDYGARPIRPLEKITRIYAPELNLYTIGCTLASATMWAQLSQDPKASEAAAADAAWWMQRTTSLGSGAAVESAVWAHKFLPGESLHEELAEMLRTRFLPLVVEAKDCWWTAAGGRLVQGLDGVAYYYRCIEQNPAVAAALMKAAYYVCSPQSATGIPRLLSKEQLSTSEWIYLNFAAVSLANLLEPEITRKPARVP
jgi:hypothetical protein